MIRTGIVWRLEANRFEVRSPAGVFPCVLAGKLKKEKGVSGRPVAVGDEVEFEPGEGGEGRIEAVLPRRNELARADVHNPRVRQVLLANMDQAVVVQAAAHPALDWHVLDRSLVMAAAGGMPALICINKMDVMDSAPGGGSDPGLRSRGHDSLWEAIGLGLARYRAAGYIVFAVSAADGRGLEELRSCLRGRSSALLGPSGVGKSSLINALVPGLGLKVEPLATKVDQGRHTTTWFELVPLAGGGAIADVPGLEVFDPWGLTRASLAGCFPEFAGPADACRFKDCRHAREPGCAVKGALGGAVSRERHESYLKILESLPP